jgi:hypothetical protein
MINPASGAVGGEGEQAEVISVPRSHQLGCVMAIPETISHSVGYYLQPPAWVGDSAPEITPDLAVEKLSEIVCERTVQGSLKCKSFREGLFTFDFSECLDRFTGDMREDRGIDSAARCRARQAAVLNCHLMCLYTSLCSPGTVRVLPRIIVEPSDLVLGSGSDGLGAYRTNRTAYLAVARFPSTYNPNLPKHLDWRNLTRRSTVIKPAEVERSFAMFDDVLGRSNANRLISLADLLARAVKALSELSFEVSLGLSWMVCEAVKVHTPNKRDAAVLPAKRASTASTNQENTLRFCRRQVSTTVSRRSTNRLPSADCVPNDSFRQITA